MINVKNICISLFLVWGLNIPYTAGYASNILEYQFDKNTMISQKLKKAKECIDKGNYSSAKTYLNGVLKLDKNNKKAKELLNICNNGGKTVQNSKPTNSSSYFYASRTDLKFSASGGTENITMYCNSEWIISARPNTWGHLSRNGNSITISVDSNPYTDSRSDCVIFKCGTKEVRINIFQSGNSKYNNFSASRENLSFTANGGNETIRISSNDDWKITVYPSSWGHLSRNGDYLTLTVDANTSSYSRSDYIKLKSGSKEIKINISQSGQSSFSTNFTVSKTDLSFSSYGGSETITIYGTNNWEISVPSASWGKLTKNGNSITVTVSGNSSSQQRTDYFKIRSGSKEIRINVSQSGSYTSTYSYSSSNNSYSYNSSYNSHKEWWKDRISFGWNCFHMDFSGNIWTVGTGMKVRFGKWDDIVNILTGLEYNYMACTNDDVTGLSYSTSPYTICHHLEIPFTFRLNVGHVSSGTDFYIGCSYIFGRKIGGGEINYLELRENAQSFEPQLGFAGEILDLGFYYRKYIEGHYYTRYKYDKIDIDRFGMFMTLYF